MTILSWIYKFLFDLFLNHKYEGELLVTGKDEVRFELHCKPDYVDVHFADDDSNAPCDPGSADTVDWEVVKACCEHKCEKKCKCCKKNNKRWTLIIRWSVAGARKIVWEVQG